MGFNPKLDDLLLLERRVIFMLSSLFLIALLPERVVFKSRGAAQSPQRGENYDSPWFAPTGREPGGGESPRHRALKGRNYLSYNELGWKCGTPTGCKQSTLPSPRVRALRALTLGYPMSRPSGAIAPPYSKRPNKLDAVNYLLGEHSVLKKWIIYKQACVPYIII